MVIFTNSKISYKMCMLNIKYSSCSDGTNKFFIVQMWLEFSGKTIQCNLKARSSFPWA